MSAIFLANQAINPFGVLESGSIIRFYLAGTNFTTPLNVFSDDDLTIDAGTFITADDAGLFPPVYLQAEMYAIRMESALGVILPYDIDPYNGNGGSGTGSLAVSVDRHLVFSAMGVLGNNEKLATAILGKTMNFQANNTKNTGMCDIAPTADFSMTIKQEGATVITANFTMGNRVATMVGVGVIAFQPNQMLTLHGPAVADATAADFAFSLYLIEP
ncbi:MAG: hypothetical protein COB36_11635 [Alphaproteobacteria bacterium]|nr:MAG: hypothetical protein COB36_11635 [Alphaproteobacteria bacterium]